MPGDVVFIPDKRLKEVSEATNNVYKFRCKNTPEKFKLQLLIDGEPRADEAYELELDGDSRSQSLGQGNLAVLASQIHQRRMGLGSAQHRFRSGLEKKRRRDLVRRKTILKNIRAGLDDLIKPLGINLEYQKAILSNKLQEFLGNDAEAIRFGDTKAEIIPGDFETEGAFGVSIYPIWKKILALYCAKKNLTGELLTPNIEKLDSRDYCFASLRKPPLAAAGSRGKSETLQETALRTRNLRRSCQ